MSNKRTSARILIVDDEANVRSVLMRLLADRYGECVKSHGAFDALNKLKRDKFSLVLSDVMMPGMTGTELLAFIRKNDPDTAVIMITGVTDIAVAVECLRMGASDYITKPFELPAVQRAVGRALERRQLLLENRLYQQLLEQKVHERARELRGTLKELEDSYRITLEALVAALDAREHETQAHSKRVQEYTLALARRVGLEGDELVQAGRGALLHDVGKIGVPDSILLKPGKLSVEEWMVMRKHPQIGREILQGIKFLDPAAEIVLTHQERWDGRGYPNRLGLTDIPLGARIFSVADTLDAMTSDRPYREAMTFEVATQEILRCSGSQFDPHIVEAFFSVPGETWLSIHDTVNQSYQSQDYCNVICGRSSRP